MRTTSAQLQHIGVRYFEDELRLNPVMGSYTLGEARFDGKLLINIAPAEVAKHKTQQIRVLRELAALTNGKA